jgi:hypothetical protein
MNNFKNNNRRSRFKPNNDRGFRRNGNGHKPNGEFSNGSSFKRRHPGKNNQNAAKLIDKYNDLAREALSNGDKILSENYLQHSEHFSRILQSQEIARHHPEKIEEKNIESKDQNQIEEKELEKTKPE